jgi:sn-glycerol 3-phosphate transport system permease protein
MKDRKIYFQLTRIFSAVFKFSGKQFTWPTILCVCSAILWVSPFLWMVAASFRPDSGGADIASVIPPFPLSFHYFAEAFDSVSWGRLYWNTLIFTLGTLVVQIVTITMAGYAFAFGNFKGRDILFQFFLIQLMLVPVVLMVPNMMTLKNFGLLDTLPGVMAPYFASAFGTFLVRQAFRSIPREMEEAAQVEGATLFQILFHILIPAIRPSLIAFSIISITAHWNEYLWPLMALNNPDNHVLTIGLVSFAMGAEAGAEWGLIAAGTLMVCLPLMMAFILFQKQFITSFGFTDLK